MTLQKKTADTNNNIFQEISENLLSISYSSYRKDWKSIPHTHSFCEIFYITKGEGTLLLNNGQYPLKRDDLIIVNPHMLHTEASSPESSLSYIVLGIENLNFQFHDESPSASCSIRNFSSEKDHSLLSLIRLMLEEKRTNGKNSAQILQRYLSALLLKIEQTTLNDFSPCVPEKIPHECLLVKKYIDNHFNQPLSLNKFAEMTHRTIYGICHSFSQTYGISPMHYLTEKRILTAKDLLCNSDYNIIQIAEMTGFSSASYFSSAFKHHTGLSPREFRMEKQYGKTNISEF